ncbi:MAG TPA: pyridoxal phosphate-dependent aminotransferase [Burkholderiaceae bacterium]|nr:pyridoxal phosphate-dependent aminotransferase [Burkholderiaceae bacterium]
MTEPAARVAHIEPFYVMEVMKAAARLEAAGRSIIHLSIGEPDFTAPAPVQRAAAAAIERGMTQYTSALGLPALREAIARDYAHTFGLRIDPARVVVTAGASAALLLTCALLVERDSEVLLPDPCYPCNRQFVLMFEGRPRLMPCGADTRFQPTADHLREHWSAATRGILLASPSNPTGTSLEPAVRRALVAQARASGGFVIIDEIYQRLSYDVAPATAAEHDDAFVLNSFSKYFCMTGWRLGWLVAPPGLSSVIEKLAQNLYICPPAISQHAALACFSEEALAVYEDRHAEFRRRRDYLVDAIRVLGFGVPVVPDGAFYIYADVSRFSQDSWSFAFELLEQSGVCVVPGRDFGRAEPHRYVRLSYATSLERLQEAVERMRAYLGRRSG